MGHSFMGHIGLAKETDWGTAVGATDYIEALDESLTLALDRFETRNIYGGNYEPDDMAGVQRIEGSISAAAHPIGVGYFLKGVFGQSSITEVLSGTLWTNEFATQQSDTSSQHPLPAYTFEIFRDVTSSQQYDGAQFTSLEFSAAPNQDLRMTANLMCKGSQSIAKTTPSFPGSPANPFAFDTASISIGGTAVDLVEALTINIDNQLEGIPALNNSTEIARVKRTGSVLIRISGTMEFQDLTETDNFVNQTEQAFVATFFRANSFQLAFDLPRVVYTAYPLGQSGRARNTVAFEGMARYLTTSATAARVSLTTTKSDY